ncbi:NfeD family protein [uncultured Sphingomonas sp.]|uniref:NfeD family protein n=1 Tax=uncultured Sphingomonas sp. TaxID=158754 RepID=UPI0035CB4390
MSPADLGLSASGAWLLVALALGLAELAVPGVFLVFVALAAAVTGTVLLAVPDLPIVGQLASLALWSGAGVAIGRRWYHEHPVATDDALLNDRAARLIGEVVVITAAIENGRGRVRVGDGAWPARGTDAATGERVRVVSVDGTVLVVERLDDPGHLVGPGLARVVDGGD